MQRQRDDVLAHRQLRQHRIGRRAGGATLRGEELKHHLALERRPGQRDLRRGGQRQDRAGQPAQQPGGANREPAATAGHRQPGLICRAGCHRALHNLPLHASLETPDARLGKGRAAGNKRL
jgi:hypothetical protein